jgi:histidinol dehydrogenase
MAINFYNLSALNRNERKQLLVRSSVDLSELTNIVRPVLDAIRDQGDSALLAYTEKFDKACMKADDLRVSSRDMENAFEMLDANLVKAMEISISNIIKFHKRQIETTQWELEIMPGIIAGEKIIPIDSVGLYVPRGKGSFPSMMMMSAIPAIVAGVHRIVVVSPPDKHGKADPATMVAAKMLGLSEFYAVGGVQAIGALAYGTETIHKVDKIVGPGSGFVMAAKQVVAAFVDTGLPAGPSESIIFADNSVEPELIVSDLLIEAEHGPDSSAYLVICDESLGKKVLELLPIFIAELSEERRSYCQTVLETNGGIVLAANIEEAVDFINDFAPEHLQILSTNASQLFNEIRFAGEVLLGAYTPSTLANYSLGPNAILPTSGFARTGSALSVRDFTRSMSYAEVSREGFMALAPHTLALAEYEGFPAHAGALKRRLES